MGAGSPTQTPDDNDDVPRQAAATVDPDLAADDEGCFTSVTGQGFAS